MSVKARFLSVLTLALAACCLAACAFAPAPQSAGESAASAPQSAAESESAGESASAADGESVGAGALSAAEERLAALTLREKVGQLFLIRPESLCAGLSPDEVHDASGPAATAWDEDMAAMLAEYPASGVVLFGKNIASPEQLSDFVIAMQRAASTGLFIGVDEEGGSVSRIANTPGFDVPVFESMQAVGETGDAANAREVGAAIGAYLRLYGFNLDFAPVADVNTNPENVVIGARAFGSDPALVARMDAAVLEGSLTAIASADLLIVGGTSLTVYPAAGLIDAYTGSRLVLVNKTATGRDARADLVLREPIGALFSRL